MEEDEEDMPEEYTRTDVIDDALSPPEKAVPTNWMERPKKDVDYHVVTGNRGNWSTAPAKVTKTKNPDMGRCNLYFTRYTQNAVTGWTSHNVIYGTEEDAARIAADLHEASMKHGSRRSQQLEQKFWELRGICVSNARLRRLRLWDYRAKTAKHCALIARPLGLPQDGEPVIEQRFRTKQMKKYQITMVERQEIAEALQRAQPRRGEKDCFPLFPAYPSWQVHRKLPPGDNNNPAYVRLHEDCNGVQFYYECGNIGPTWSPYSHGQKCLCVTYKNSWRVHCVTFLPNYTAHHSPFPLTHSWFDTLTLFNTSSHTGTDAMSTGCNFFTALPRDSAQQWRVQSYTQACYMQTRRGHPGLSLVRFVTRSSVTSCPSHMGPMCTPLQCLFRP